MADDLDQGYMQTRQTMRDWQNRMLFMETTQEGNQVHMGVQVGGKETDGGKAGPPGQAETPQQAPVTLAPDATTPEPTAQAQQRNTITVDTPEVAAVRQQFKEKTKPYVFDLDTFDVPGDVVRAGLAKLSGVDRGDKEGTLRMSSDEMVNKVFFQYGDKPEEVIKRAEELGLPEADTLKIMSGLSAVVLGMVTDPLNVTPGGKAKDVAKVGKLVGETSKAVTLPSKAKAFGAEWQALLADGATNAGHPRHDEYLEMFTQREVDQLVAEGARNAGHPKHDEYISALEELATYQELPPMAAARKSRTAQSRDVKNEPIKADAFQRELDALIADGVKNAGHPRHEDYLSALAMQEIDALTKQGARNAGHPKHDEFLAAIEELAKYDPQSSFTGFAPAGTSREKILSEFKRAANILKSERGSVPLGGGGAGKPPDVPPVNIGGAAEEPISPKALSTISRREQAKSDFAIKVAGFKEALTKQRRGPVLSDEAVRKLAGESGFTLQDLLDLKPGSILAPEIQVAARDVFKASADKMKASAKAYLERADPQAFDEFAQAFAEAGIATTRIIGTFAEGGRTFRLFNQKYPTLKTGVKPDGKDPEFSIQDQYIQEMYKFFRGVEEKSAMGGFEGARGGAAQPGMVSPAQLAQMVMDLPNEEAMMKFAKEAVKPTWGDMMMEVWINGLLSGPITHSTNIISNAATVAWNIPERAVASMLSPKAVRPGEAAAMLGGVVESVGDAWRLAWKAFKEEQPQFGQAKLEMPRRAITADALEVTGMTGRAVDFLGAAVRLPGRFLMAGDDFFKAIAFRAELRALAKRQAFREINEMSLTGKAAAQKAKEIEKNILDSPPESIKEAAQEFAAYTTFTRDLGETGQKVQALASTPIGRIVMPFVRTPTNIFKFAGERTPLALASRAVREEIAAGGERRALALAKIGLGSMTMAYMSTLAANGLITGGGPKDKALRQIKMQTGWKPYSFKIGNEYISYARIEPLGSLFGLAADAADIMGQLSEADAAKLASALTVAISRNVAQKTFVKGLAGTLSAVTSQEVKQVNSFLEKELPTILPYSSALGQTAKNVDPVMREVNSIMDAFKAKIPGYSSDLPPHRNLWGEPVLLEGGLGPDLLSPFYSSTMKDDKVAAELDRLQAPITLPSKQIDRVPLTPKQYDRYQILAAHPQGMPSLREKLEEVIASDLYRHGTDDPADGGKITLLKMWVNNYRDLAKFQLRQEDADLDAKLRERETKKAGAFAGTAPGGLSR